MCGVTWINSEDNFKGRCAERVTWRAGRRAAERAERLRAAPPPRSL
jgi:hypothetical protein